MVVNCAVKLNAYGGRSRFAVHRDRDLLLAVAERSVSGRSGYHGLGGFLGHQMRFSPRRAVSASQH